MHGFSANISLLFREVPLLERFAAARDAGFSAVEIQIPYEHPAAVVASAARAAGVAVILINAPMGEDPRSFGTASLPHRAALFRAELERAAEYAQALGAGMVSVLAGRTTPQEQPCAVRRLTDNLQLAAEVLGRVGARAQLEVINPVTVPGYCVPDFALASDILDACGGQVGLQFDIYHAAMLGLDPALAFSRHRDRIVHVQFADCPGRHEPGTGRLDLQGIFRLIRAGGYAGWLGAEYDPVAATTAGLGWMRRYAWAAQAGRESQ
ncbi:MAG TPA: TIM barrel protein [Steroidobacteraceae bacterium]|nr:TIM barrel protein [Steroidobacteraceae bacterium]